MSDPRHEFYVGYVDTAPPGLAAVTRARVTRLLLLVLAVAVLLVLGQRRLGVATFEFGAPRTFTGVLVADPVPTLLVARPGVGGGVSRYPLVAPFKFGADELVAEHVGRLVRLEATLAHRGERTLLELVPDSLTPADGAGPRPAAAPVEPLGVHTLVGEIVDSKCFLGVMNPGATRPHRACATRCISGGIPPVLLVRQADGGATYLMLVDEEGRTVNERVLGRIAEPIEITGAVERHDDLLVLRANPSTYASP